MNILWSKDLETGNTEIDTEHKELIKITNSLIDACKIGAGRSKISEAADFLLSYTKTHFHHEETLQLQHKYPDYTAHKAWHQEFAKQIETLLKSIKTEQPTVAMVAAINKEIGILIAHIRKMDVQLAKHIQSTK